MSIFNKVTKTFQWGQHTVTMETGEIARQASGAVLVNIDDTVVLATVVASKQAKSGQDFFPLTVDYIERSEEHTLNSSHLVISYAVFCLKKKKKELTVEQSQYAVHPPLLKCLYFFLC